MISGRNAFIRTASRLRVESGIAVFGHKARIYRLETTFRVIRINPKAFSVRGGDEGCDTRFFNQHSTNARAPHSNNQTVVPRPYNGLGTRLGLIYLQQVRCLQERELANAQSAKNGMAFSKRVLSVSMTSFKRRYLDTLLICKV